MHLRMDAASNSALVAAHIKSMAVCQTLKQSKDHLQALWHIAIMAAELDAQRFLGPDATGCRTELRKDIICHPKKTTSLSYRQQCMLDGGRFATLQGLDTANRGSMRCT